MKLALTAGALALVAVSGCAFVTERTGLSTEAQVCIATEAAELVQDPDAREIPMLEKIGIVANACQIDLNQLVQGTIQTAILAADKAE